MESLKELYRIGPGPSSSHTLAIKRACEYFISKDPQLQNCTVKLYGSLALTGKGHMTDKIILNCFEGKNVKIEFINDFNPAHPNTLVLYDDDTTRTMTIYSIGGGAFEVEGEDNLVDKDVFPHNNMSEIIAYCNSKEMDLYEYVIEFEPEIEAFLFEILEQMLRTVDNGLSKEGVLPGPLKMQRVAKNIFQEALISAESDEKRQLLLTAFAYSCSESNASGDIVVTAPTLGSCGVVPAAMAYYLKEKKYSVQLLAKSLAVAGLFGNVIKTNATISGAEGGCQAEIGAACAMAAAACAYLEGLSMNQIDYAAEIGIEHHLGLTCDPIGGYVMIPCIERNGVAALRAMDAMLYAKHLGKIRSNRISFDMVVQTMNYTGQKLAVELKETSLGGLALTLVIDEENT